MLLLLVMFLPPTVVWQWQCQWQWQLLYCHVCGYGCYIFVLLSAFDLICLVLILSVEKLLNHEICGRVLCASNCLSGLPEHQSE